jgi:hypothetical protein
LTPRKKTYIQCTQLNTGPTPCSISDRDNRNRKEKLKMGGDSIKGAQPKKKAKKKTAKKKAAKKK